MSGEVVLFAGFELDRAAYQLRRKGRVVHLERIPLELLFLLVERRSQLVTREEIRNRIWGPDVFVDEVSSINTAIRKLRRVLRDSPASSRFIETVSTKATGSLLWLTRRFPRVFRSASPTAGARVTIWQRSR